MHECCAPHIRFLLKYGFHLSIYYKILQIDAPMTWRPGCLPLPVPTPVATPLGALGMYLPQTIPRFGWYTQPLTAV